MSAGTVAVLAVLHTWTQQLNLHPHVYTAWSAAAVYPRTPPPGIRHRRKLLVPIKALDKLVRGKFPDFLRRKQSRSRHPGGRVE